MNPSKFQVDLIPKTSFYSNVRTHVSSSDWDILRKLTYKQANHRCEGCGKAGKMEAHEIWSYDDQKYIQKLERIACYCNTCHMCHHLGFAQISGKFNLVKNQLKKINGWTEEETMTYITRVFSVWKSRSQHNWILDLSLLDSYNIKYKK